MLLGGSVAGCGLANAGLTTGRLLSSAPGLLGRTATSATDAAALGSIAGFNEGNGLNDRLTKAGESALTGALVGGALPIGFAAAKGVVSPFLSNIIAQINPEGLARRQVARAIVESGEAPDEIARALQRAQVQGQGHFTVADALGNAGQRMLSTVARAPGEGRTSVASSRPADVRGRVDGESGAPHESVRSEGRDHADPAVRAVALVALGAVVASFG